jgi:hypothetical protein
VWTSVSYQIEVPLGVAVPESTLAAAREMVTTLSEVSDQVYFYETLAASRSLLGCRSNCSCLLPSIAVGHLETDSGRDAVEAQQALVKADQIAGKVEPAFVVAAGSHHTGCLPRTD